MNERQLLAAFAFDRAAYNTVLGYITPEDFSARGQLILAEIDKYYEIDPEATRVDPTILAERIKRTIPNPKQAAQFGDIVQELASEGQSPQNIVVEYLELKRDRAGDALAGALAARRPREEISGLLDDYDALLNATTLDFEPKEHVERDLEKLMRHELDQSNKIRVLPGKLNKMLTGGVNRGDCLVVFGRPNSGKSLFCINAASGWLKDGLRVLWIENEERGNRTLKRIACRLAGVPIDRWMDDEQGHIERAKANGYDRLRYESMTPGTLREIDQLIADFKPDVFVVNQIRNLAIKGESFVRQLDLAANRLRAMGKRYNALSVLVTQAYAPPPDHHGNVRDKPVLYMEDIDSSKTGIPAAGDVIIGYGISHDLWQQKIACLNIAKSKFGIQDHFYVNVVPEIDKLESK